MARKGTIFTDERRCKRYKVGITLPNSLARAPGSEARPGYCRKRLPAWTSGAADVSSREGTRRRE